MELVNFLQLNIFCLLICIYSTAQASSAYKDEVAKGGRSGNPGVQIRLTKKGVEYLNSIAGDAMNEVIPKIPVPDFKNTFNGGFIELSDLQIINFRRPDRYVLQLDSPNLVLWTLENMDIGVKGRANGKYGAVGGKGDFDSTGYNTNFDMTLSVVNEGGKVRIHVDDCKAKAKTMEMNIYNFPKNVQNMFNKFKRIVIADMKPKLEKELCTQLKDFINNDLNDELRKMNMKMPVNKQKFSILEESGLVESSSSSSSASSSNSKTYQDRLRNILAKLFLDYSMTKDPQMNNNEVADIFSKGEVSYMGQGNTPFFPNSMSYTATPSDKMVYAAISDYAINSMFYHAYQQNLLTFTLNKDDTPDFASLFKPSCSELSGEICINSVLPEFAKTYPNYDSEIQLIPTQAPAIVVRNGKAIIYTEAEVKLFAKKGSAKILVLTITESSDADVKLRLENNMVKGNMTITRMNAKLVSSTLKEITQATLDKDVELAKMVVENIANSEMAKGFPFPTVKEARLVNPILVMADRQVLIYTDLNVDKSSISRLMNKVAENASKKLASKSNTSRNSSSKKNSKKDKK